MKRFYKIVSHRKTPEGYALLLDGRPVHTPAENKLVCVNEALADELMKEWSAQGAVIAPETMPLTQLASTKIDRVVPARPAMSAALLKYLDTDLLCYRAAGPPEMARAQAEAWDKWLGWFEKRFGSALKTTTGLQALSQPAEAHALVCGYIKAQCDDRFTVLQLLAALSGSLVLALAFMEGAAAPQDIFNAVRAEELYNARLYNEKKYGPHPAQEKKDQALKKDLAAAKHYLALAS